MDSPTPSLSRDEVLNLLEPSLQTYAQSLGVHCDAWTFVAFEEPWALASAWAERYGLMTLRNFDQGSLPTIAKVREKRAAQERHSVYKGVTQPKQRGDAPIIEPEDMVPTVERPYAVTLYGTDDAAYRTYASEARAREIYAEISQLENLPLAEIMETYRFFHE